MPPIEIVSTTLTDRATLWHGAVYLHDLEGNLGGNFALIRLMHDNSLKEAGNQRPFAEDSAALVRGLPVPESETATTGLLQKLFEEAEYRMRFTPGTQASATMVAAFAGEEGIYGRSAGDSMIFIMGNKGVFQLTYPSGQVEPVEGLLTNCLYGSSSRPKMDRSNDWHGFVSYEEIEEKAGHAAVCIVTSDGIFKHLGIMPTEAACESCLREARMLVRYKGDGTGVDYKNPGFAKELARECRYKNHHDGVTDDIAIAAFPVSAKGTLGMVSDGVGSDLNAHIASICAIEGAVAELGRVHGRMTVIPATPPLILASSRAPGL